MKDDLILIRCEKEEKQQIKRDAEEHGKCISEYIRYLVAKEGEGEMSKTTDIREICGDYAFNVEYSKDNTFTMFFNSRRNAETVKRCIEADDSVPNVATAIDFVEVVRCKDCIYWKDKNSKGTQGICLCGEKDVNYGGEIYPFANDFCSYGKPRTPQNDEVRE